MAHLPDFRWGWILSFKSLQHLLLLLSCFSCGSLFAMDLKVVVNIQNTSEFTPSQIAQLYLRKTDQFSDGYRVNLYHLPRNSADHQQFCRQLMNLTASQYQSYWSRLLFTGNVDAMVHLQADQLIAQIARDPLAIGYLPQNTPTEGLRVIALIRSEQIEILPKER